MDIPVKNLERASNFYGHLIGLEFVIEDSEGVEFAPCPHKDNEAAFCLVVEPNFKPYNSDQTSPLIYLNLDGRLDEALSEVEKYGGKILTDKEQIGPHGFRAIILDSEGNRIALHSY
jgi:predicted enzyme related to lactoylglutathione lyase